MKKMLFSQAFQTIQRVTIDGKTEARIFHGEVPAGFVGFLGSLASNDYEGVIWSWYIDDECVEKNILQPLGDMQKPKLLKPPYVMKKYVTVNARNTLDIPVTLEVYCDGILYEQEMKTVDSPQTMMPLENTLILKEIRDEIKSKTPLGEVTDELVDVTDAVQDVYDEAQHGLNWTSCSIINQGPNNVYYAVNEWKQPVAPIPLGESQNVDLGRRGSIKRIYLKCDAGETAQVRLHVLK